jgi:hypothetical protein
MSGEEGKKVRGNQKGQKGKGSGGAPNPLVAVMAHVPKASAKRNTKGASHTQALNTKGASHTQALNTKGASHTQASEGKKITNTPHLSLSESKEGTSNTPVPNLTKFQKRMAFSSVVEKSESLKGKKRTKPKRQRNRWPPL